MPPMLKQLKEQAPCPVKQARILVTFARRAIDTVPGMEVEKSDLSYLVHRLQTHEAMKTGDAGGFVVVH